VGRSYLADSQESYRLVFMAEHAKRRGSDVLYLPLVNENLLYLASPSGPII
jgi:hypothetical protein